MSYKVEPDYKYLPEHDWAKVEGDLVVIGVTDYAQKTLKDVVYVELPEVGDTFEFKAVFGSIESVKAVSDLIIPLAGEVVEVNEELADEPEKVNEFPYSAWLIKIKPSNLEEDWNKLMTSEEYAKHCEED
ncbi:MAG: glycine cleavage system protein GcvH [Candidatus Hodarchaeales archaeon]|jgi:glycine cleavage system H protein